MHIHPLSRMGEDISKNGHHNNQDGSRGSESLGLSTPFLISMEECDSNEVQVNGHLHHF